MRASSFCSSHVSASPRDKSRLDWGMTYGQKLAGAEASSAVIPVVVLELVDLDALAIIERRSGKCHHQLDVAHCLTP